MVFNVFLKTEDVNRYLRYETFGMELEGYRTVTRHQDLSDL